MYCRNCGARVDDDSNFCPFCGAPIQSSRASTGSKTTVNIQDDEVLEDFKIDDEPNYYTPPAQEWHAEYDNANENVTTSSEEKNGLAIAAFVLAFIYPFVGLILGIIALKRSKQMNGNGRGLSIASIVISVVWYLILFILLMTTI